LRGRLRWQRGGRPSWVGQHRHRGRLALPRTAGLLGPNAAPVGPMTGSHGKIHSQRGPAAGLSVQGSLGKPPKGCFFLIDLNRIYTIYHTASSTVLHFCVLSNRDGTLDPQ